MKHIFCVWFTIELFLDYSKKHNLRKWWIAYFHPLLHISLNSFLTLSTLDLFLSNQSFGKWKLHIVPYGNLGSLSVCIFQEDCMVQIILTWMKRFIREYGHIYDVPNFKPKIIFSNKDKHANLILKKCNKQPFV